MAWIQLRMVAESCFFSAKSTAIFSSLLFSAVGCRSAICPALAPNAAAASGSAVQAKLVVSRAPSATWAT